MAESPTVTVSVALSKASALAVSTSVPDASTEASARPSDVNDFTA